MCTGLEKKVQAFGQGHVGLMLLHPQGVLGGGAEDGAPGGQTLHGLWPIEGGFLRICWFTSRIWGRQHHF